jgi:hypothetical protein
VITTTNQGLASARNNGISAARGDYILPLDADDKIGVDYLKEAVAVLDDRSDIGIVYCQARLFGGVDADWLLPQYSLEEILKDNVIFCTALFRKSDWESVGGYDPGMIYGWEDYDFWLSLIERGRGVKQLSGQHFHYRVASDSMVRSKEKWQKVEMFLRIYHRHKEFIGEHIHLWLSELIEVREPYRTCRLYVDGGEGFSEQDSVSRKVGTGRHVIRFDIDNFNNKKRLRFDPVDCPACVRLNSIKFLSDSREKVLQSADVGSNALNRDGNVFRFSGSDPQMYLEEDVSLIKDTQTVVIDFEISSIGLQALQEMVLHQQEIIGGNHSPKSSKTLFDSIKLKLSGRR